MDVLFIFPPVIENIFRYLTMRELDCCAKVCDLWKELAETEKSRREDIAFFSQQVSPYQDEHSEGLESALTRQLKELKMKPEFCLAFASSDLVSHFGRFFRTFLSEDLIRRRAYLRAVVQTALKQHLSKECQVTFCVAPGVVGCEAEEGCGISGLLIPSVPGLRILTFPINDERHCNLSGQIPLDVKCLLMFLTPHASSGYGMLIESCLLRQNYRLALGGALIERSESGCGSAVVFCGQAVEAASVVVGPRDREAEVERRLQSFRETGLLEDRCFAFMFTCVARGHYVYGGRDAESSLFHKLYPDIPLIGTFGNGEIGLDYLPNSQKIEPILRIGKLTRCRRRYLHSYTTIFVLVSLKM